MRINLTLLLASLVAIGVYVAAGGVLVYGAVYVVEKLLLWGN